MNNALTEEQRQLIALNKQKALERRAARLLQNAPKPTPEPQKSFPGSIDVSSHVTLSFGKDGLQSGHQSSASFPLLLSSLNKKTVQGTCQMISSSRFKVQVPYHQEMITIFRSIPSGAYNAKEKTWDFNIEYHTQLMSALKPIATSAVVSPLPRHILRTFKKGKTNNRPKMDVSKLDPTLWDTLLPFQQEGVAFGISRNGRVLIADDMGLGKTIQAIAIAAYYRNEWPLLVTAPSSMRYSWREAFHIWMPTVDPQDVAVPNSSKDATFDSLVTIISYDLLTKKALEIQNKAYKVVIIDESHFLKSPKSARTKAAQKIMKKSKRLILLTGTPALSRPIELYTQVSAVGPTVFPMVSEFGLRYCDGKLTQWGWDYSGSCNMRELQVLLEETVMIRRLKSEVIQQLPAKCRQMVVLDPVKINTGRKELKNIAKQMSKTDLKGMERRGMLLQYFHETGLSKLDAVCDYIKDLLESGKKFLCFAHHHVVLDGICETLEKKGCKYIRIDGATSSEKRKQLCDRFQYADECRVAVLSITAANTGITLTAAQFVVFAELFWNPGVLTQAEDRAHRIGQQDSVVIQYLVARRTADDYIWPLVQGKLNTLNKAGLSKDNFFDADTITQTDPCQRSIMEFMKDVTENSEFLDKFLAEEFNSEILDEPAVKKCKA